MEPCLRIRLAQVPSQGKRYNGSISPDILDLSGDAEYMPLDEIVYEFSVQVVSDRLILKGSLRTRVRFICARCVSEGELDVEGPDFRVVKEVCEDTEYVDLTQDIREAIILAFPGYPVCRPDCKGLCPRCGKNLNEGQCDCEFKEDVRWSALNNLDLTEE